jgi:acyl-CoA synthetase (NDP forming)
MLSSRSEHLARLLGPKSVAVVGANEKLGMSNNAILPMLDAGIDVKMVNPSRDTVYGRPALPSLSALAEPVDAVLALVNAARSVDVVREAVALGCGGVALAAGGFAEAGEAGVALQAEIEQLAAASGLAIVGPNCSGFMNVPLGMNLFTGGRIALRPGPVAVVSQSGFLVRAALAAAQQRQLGISIAVSSGNEAVCGLADYVELFAADPQTKVICLVVEKVRDPERFFAAVRAARENGTAVIALKLGRSASARAILQSHTGAIADESWVYELAFREHGVLAARDVDDLLDQAQLFAQLPQERWAPMRNAAMITSSGGVAALATDLAEGTGAELPALEALRPWVTEQIPGTSALNPLDLTGFVATNAELSQQLFTKYANQPEVDLLVLCWWLGEGDEAWGRLLLKPFAATDTDTPLLVTPVEATALGSWTDALRAEGLTVGRGITSVYRAMNAMTTYAEFVAADRPALQADTKPAPDLVGGMLGFAAAMELLRDCGITPAPYAVLAPGEEALPAGTDLGELLVVKLADVPHRTELGAVSVGVSVADLGAEVRRMRALAAAHGVPDTVVVQAMVSGLGEVFAGIHGRTDLGPVALFGRGGVQVETSGGVAGRTLPMSAESAVALVDETAGPAVFAHLRGATAWDTAPLVEVVRALNALWQRTASWAGSIDINPLIVTADGVVAVDALVLADRI